MKIKLFKNVQLPKKSHLPDSGLDCFMPESFELKPLETKTIGLGIGIQVPEGFAGMLVPRSSIAEKGLLIQTSIIDPDYTGEIHLIITNCSNNNVVIENPEDNVYEQNLRKGDIIIKVDEYSVNNPQSVQKYIEEIEFSNNQTVNLSIMQNNELKNVTIKLESETNEQN